MITKKQILLFLGLGLPILIFLFLRFFGKNQFDVALPYANGVERVPADCSWNYGVPYTLPDTLWTKIQTVGDKKLILISYVMDDPNLKHILDEFTPQEIFAVNGSALEPNDLFSDFIQRCLLLLEHPQNTVLIDSDRNIRGQYNVYEQDDLDRLQTEMTIILKKF